MAMAQAARLNLRMQKELKLLLTDPPPGASFPTLSSGGDSSLTSIDALFQGPEGTVYSSGVFKIKIQIPERYPFQPPIVTFATPIYHPNIDNGGRICLDILNLPPKGMWQPSLNISTVLTSIGLLLTEPNPDDGLMHDASRDYKYNRQAFDHNARSMTEKYARAGITEIHTGQNTSQTKIEGSVASVCISLDSPGCSNYKRDSGEEISENTVNFGKLHATPKVPVASHSTNGESENTNMSNQCSSLQTTSVLSSLNTNHSKTDGTIRLKKRGLVESKASDKENLAPLRCLLPQLTDKAVNNKVNDAMSCGESADEFKEQSLDAVVVLDSEDSDEENVTAVRSKTFVSRKRKSVNFANFRQLQ